MIIISSFVSSLNSISITAVYATENGNNSDYNGCLISVVICLSIQREEEYKEEDFDKKHAIINLVNSTKLEDWVNSLSSFHTRHTKSEYIESVAYWLFRELQNICEDEVHLHNFSQADQGTSYSLKNVVCNKEGSMVTEKNNNNHLILISAHYDSRMQNINQTNARAPGADDNASGVAAVLELARILSRINLKNDIQFVLFSGEEQGQWGSKAYAQDLRANDTEVDMIMNLDMIGYPPRGLNQVVIEYDYGNKVRANDIFSLNAAQFIENIAQEYTNIQTSLRTLGKTDLIPFEAAGNIVVGLHDGGSELNPHYHNVSDTASTLDIEYLSSVTKLALAAILELDQLSNTS
ncbi:MAG: M20/M25/M40 family metallo-hydrolase [Thermoproteota archaeon]|nr:M20/M25/M40 family metallo-hydrolase [Thermoproteota archaeon]